MVVEHVRRLSVEEYLDFVDQSEEWYEYINGELILMTGGKLNHYRIVNRILIILGSRLADTDCEVLASGMLVKAGESRLLAPDVSVVCGQPLTESDTHVLLNPTLVTEVTSPTSVEYDHVSKREYYFDAPSIKTYLVVDQHRVFVELYTRSETGWHLQSFSDLDEEVPLAALDCGLHLSDIYHGIQFEDETAATPHEKQ